MQDGASAGIRSLQTSIVIKLCQTPGNGLYKSYFSRCFYLRICSRCLDVSLLIFSVRFGSPTPVVNQVQDLQFIQGALADLLQDLKELQKNIEEGSRVQYIFYWKLYPPL